MRYYVMLPDPGMEEKDLVLAIYLSKPQAERELEQSKRKHGNEVYIDERDE